MAMHNGGNQLSQSSGFQVLPPRTERISFWNQRFHSDWWTREIICALLSLGCLAAIVGILKVHSEKAVPEYAYGITLNAIVSILVTASKAFIAVGVASAIGQLKWHWQDRNDSRLYDLQIFDEGSRGPFGAAMMAFFVNIRSLALLGGAVTVLSIAVDPIAQQLLTFPTRTVSVQSPQAQVPQARNFTFIPDTGSEEDIFLDGTMSTAIAEPLYQGVYSGSRDLDVNCPAGNCEWPNFQSLAWRTQCTDRTSSIIMDGCNFTFAPDVPTDADSQLCTLSTGINDPVSVFATRRQFDSTMVRINGPQFMVWPTVDFTFSDFGTYVADGTVPDVANNFMSFVQVELGYNSSEIENGIFTGPHIISATECSLVPCVQEFSLSVSGGRLSTKVVNTTYGSFPEASGLWAAFPSSSTGDNFTISREVLDYVSLGLTTLLTGNATLLILDNTTDPATGTFQLTPGTIYRNRLAKPDSLAYVLQYRGFETTMRDIASQLTYATHQASDFTLSGSASVVESFVRVRWEWFALPTAVIILGLIFLVSTIVVSSTRKDIPIWKTSILPFLFKDNQMETPAHPDRGPIITSGRPGLGSRNLSGLRETAERTRSWKRERRMSIQVVKGEWEYTSSQARTRHT